MKDCDLGPRCRSCVQAKEFREVDPERYWLGWPKDPLQVVWERGWIDSLHGKKPDETRYPPERIGKMVVSMPDSTLLLANFENAGHYGYSGVNEELCCMPGCIKDANLKACSRCKHARYCSEEQPSVALSTPQGWVYVLVGLGEAEGLAVMKIVLREKPIIYMPCCYHAIF